MTLASPTLTGLSSTLFRSCQCCTALCWWPYPCRTRNPCPRHLRMKVNWYCLCSWSMIGQVGVVAWPYPTVSGNFSWSLNSRGVLQPFIGVIAIGSKVTRVWGICPLSSYFGAYPLWSALRRLTIWVSFQNRAELHCWDYATITGPNSRRTCCWGIRFGVRCWVIADVRFMVIIRGRCW